MSTLYSVGQMDQLADALEAAGYGREDVTRLRSGVPLLRRLKNVFDGEALIVDSSCYSVDLDAPPFVPEGWAVEKHIKGGQLGARSIVTVLDPSVNEVPYNVNLLDYLLIHPELIPVEWRVKAVFFRGTIYRHPALGSGSVRYLNGRHDKGWNWNFTIGS